MAAVSKELRVLHVSWAVHPHAAAGPGPGIAATEIPKQLNRLGIKTRIMVPEHRGMAKLSSPNKVFSPPEPITIDGRQYPLSVVRRVINGLTIYSIDSPQLFDRETLYLEKDEPARVIFFSLGLLHFIRNRSIPLD